MTERSYFDHAATTPIDPEIFDVMRTYALGADFNASSTHAEGRSARAAVDEARALVARTLGVRAREIVFAGSGSEADALAILGTARAYEGTARRIVTVATEHDAVLRCCETLAREGWSVEILPVDASGRVDAAAFDAALAPGAALATVMLANNEIGTIAPIAELAAIARARGVRFHTDAVQAPGRLALDIAELGVDLLSLASHKFYGPKGVGALVVREGVTLAPLVPGGGQESGLRSGTENVFGIVGFAHALAAAARDEPVERPRLETLRARMESEIVARIPGARVAAADAPRVAHVSSLSFPGVDAVELLVRLDLAGIAASAGSACAAGAVVASHVLDAIGLDAERARGTVRLSLGKRTRSPDIDRLLGLLPDAVRSLREAPTNVGTVRSGR